jgi:hypothetical protein
MAELRINAPGFYDICSQPAGSRVRVILGTRLRDFTSPGGGIVSLFMMAGPDGTVNADFEMDCDAAQQGSPACALPANLYVAGNASNTFNIAGSIHVEGSIYIGSLAPGHSAGMGCQ